MNTYIQVNIGRNVPVDASGAGGRTMSGWEWDRFKSNVTRAMIDSLIGPMVDIEIHNGIGTWDGEEEESVHISSFGPYDVDSLRKKLERIRSLFWQDSIALIVGSELI